MTTGHKHYPHKYVYEPPIELTLDEGEYLKRRLDEYAATTVRNIQLSRARAEGGD